MVFIVIYLNVEGKNVICLLGLEYIGIEYIIGEFNFGKKCLIW